MKNALFGNLTTRETTESKGLEEDTPEKVEYLEKKEELNTDEGV